MKTRCVSGDLAFIVHDEPGCEANLGRVVTVHGPSRLTEDRGLEWLIVPVNPSPLCFKSDGDVVWGTIPATTRIRHSDTWLMPIRPQASEEENVGNEGSKSVEKPRRLALKHVEEDATADV